MKLQFFALPLLILWNSLPAMTIEEVARAHGIEKFDRVESITFRFQATVGEKNSSRLWTWYPQTQEVYFHDRDIRYSRTGEFDPKIDAMFVNDSYWLVFPFQVVWDPKVTVSSAEAKEKAPISGDRYHKLTISYGDDGYTPGDVYELFVDDDGVIREWSFFKSGAKKPTVSSTWEDYQTIGGIPIATDHRGLNNFRIQFLDTEVRLN